MRKELITHSKFLSLVLRHNPALIGVTLDKAGWIGFDEFLTAIQVARPEITKEIIIEIVETNEKKRFAFSDDKTKIRASQGHSIGVELGLQPTIPPERLFHGTAARNRSSIKAYGLVRGKRDNVHLSVDEATALNVGARHGSPIVLTIEAGLMTKAGFKFYRSENGVWLCSHVPTNFIVFPRRPSH